MIGRVDTISRKDGKYGAFYNLTVDGEQYAAFNRAADQAAGINAGDRVNYEWMQKGNYRNITSISRATEQGGGNTSGGDQSNGVASQQSVSSSKKDDFNLMMASRYALDAVIAGKAADAKSAAQLVRDIFNELKASAKESQTQ